MLRSPLGSTVTACLWLALSACSSTSVNQAGSGGSAGVGGTGGAAGQTGAGCASLLPIPVFCQDFEQGNLTTAFQSGQAITVASPVVEPGTSTATFDPTAHGGNGAVLFTTPNVATGSSATAWYATPIEIPSASHVVLRFALRIDAYNGGGTDTAATIAKIFIRGTSSTSQVLVEYFLMPDTSAGMALTATSGYAWKPLSMPAIGMWLPVELDVQAGTATTFTVTIGNVKSPTLTGFSDFSSGKADFFLGLAEQGPFSSAGVSVDDIVFDLK